MISILSDIYVYAMTLILTYYVFRIIRKKIRKTPGAVAKESKTIVLEDFDKTRYIDADAFRLKILHVTETNEGLLISCSNAGRPLFDLTCQNLGGCPVAVDTQGPLLKYNDKVRLVISNKDLYQAKISNLQFTYYYKGEELSTNCAFDFQSGQKFLIEQQREESDG